MLLTFLGTGPDQAIPRRGCSCATCREARRPQSKSRRSRSSLLVQTKKANILIDCSPDFLEQIKKTKVKKIDAVFLTHRHQDAAGGLKLLAQWTKRSVLIYTEKINIKPLKNQLKKNQSSNLLIFKSLKPLNPIILDSRWSLPRTAIRGGNDIRSIQPFKVQHGLKPIPTLGFLINEQIAYASDFGDLPLASQKLLKNKPMAIFDAALYFNRKMKGHLNVAQTIEWAQKLKIKKFYLTQVGHSYPPYQRAKKEIRNFLKENNPNGQLSVILSYDGLQITPKVRNIRKLRKNPASHQSIS